MLFIENLEIKRLELQQNTKFRVTAGKRDYRSLDIPKNEICNKPPISGDKLKPIVSQFLR
jgi:hypothetical protein